MEESQDILASAAFSFFDIFLPYLSIVSPIALWNRNTKLLKYPFKLVLFFPISLYILTHNDKANTFLKI